MLQKIWKRVRRELYRPRIPIDACSTLVRLGSAYGGWWINETSDLVGSALLSCGLGEDGSFDVEFATRYKAEVIIVDPTPRAIEHFRAIEGRIGKKAQTAYVPGGNQPVESYELADATSGQFIMVAAAIWNVPGTVRFYAPKDPAHVSHAIDDGGDMGTRPFIEVESVTYASLSARQSRPFAVVKMDIEGAEIVVLNDILDAGSSLPGQFLIEFDVLQNPSPSSRSAVEQIDRKLRDRGYRALHFDGLRNYLYCRG